MSDVRTVTLPDLGEGLTESDLVQWLVAVGDEVALNDVVAEVETAKALVQLPSPYAGVVSELLVEPGTTVPVGDGLLRIAVDVPADESLAPDDGDGAATEPGTARTSVLVGYGPLVEGSARPRRRARSASWTAAHATVDAAPGGGRHGSPPRRPVANPLVRRLAHDLGVHLDRVEGTGPDGGATRQDVHRVAGAAGSPGPVRHARAVGSAGAIGPAEAVGSAGVTGPAGETGRAGALGSAREPGAAGDGDRAEVRVPVTGVRKQTAAAMVASAFTAPHASVFLTVDVTPATELLAELRTDRSLTGHRPTLLTLVAKAVVLALARTPEVNARWDDAGGEIVRYGHVGLGIAVATPRGLLVPVVHDADRLRVPDLADAVAALVDDARAGTTPPGDLSGSTITLTNVGVFGVDGGTPILVPGQAAIVAMGTVRRQPWEHDGEVALRQVMTLSMSFDHRVVDGAEASTFLADVGAVLARPGVVLAMV